MKKVKHMFIGRVWLHPDEGGAWITECIWGIEYSPSRVHAAFITAEYGKEWVKSFLISKTPVTEELEWKVAEEFPHPSEDEPVAFRAELNYEDYVKFN